MQSHGELANRKDASSSGPDAGAISVVGDNLTTTPDSFQIIAGIQAECEKHAKLLMIGETGGNAGNFNRLVDRFREQRTDAIIFATMSLQELSIGKSFKSCPLILVNCIDSNNRHPAIIPDDIAGGYAATRELLRLGHQRIAFLSLFDDMPATAMRIRGYRKALLEAGIEFDVSLLVAGVCRDPEDEFAQLPQVLATLFGLDKPPTAIMCGNDKMAMRTYFLLRSTMGKRIPEDVSVVGYDDYRMIATNLVPQLTTVALPYFEIGAAAARLAIAGDLSSKGQKISGELVIRDSTAACR
jgi:LacI family transcriptional regulator